MRKSRLPARQQPGSMELLVWRERCAYSRAVASSQRRMASGIFANQAKRHMRKSDGIPKEQIPLFLKECEWRFNNHGFTAQLVLLRRRIKRYMRWLSGTATFFWKAGAAYRGLQPNYDWRKSYAMPGIDVQL